VQYFSHVQERSGLSHCAQATGAGIAVPQRRMYL